MNDAPMTNPAPVEIPAQSLREAEAAEARRRARRLVAACVMAWLVAAAWDGHALAGLPIAALVALLLSPVAQVAVVARHYPTAVAIAFCGATLGGIAVAIDHSLSTWWDFPACFIKAGVAGVFGSAILAAMLRPFVQRRQTRPLARAVMHHADRPAQAGRTGPASTATPASPHEPDNLPDSGA